MTNDSTLGLRNTTINPGSYTIGLTGGTLGLGGTYSDFGAVQTDNATSLELNANTSITRSAPLEIGGLDLNAFVLTLGSATTDLTIHSTLAVDNSEFATHHKCCRFDPDISPPAHSRVHHFHSWNIHSFPGWNYKQCNFGCAWNNTKIE